MGKKCLQPRDAGERDDACPGWDKGDERFHHATPNGMQFKTYELFVSGIFCEYFRTPVDRGKLRLWKAKLWIRGTTTMACSVDTSVIMS